MSEEGSPCSNSFFCPVSLHSTWDLSFPTRKPPHALEVRSLSLDHQGSPYDNSIFHFSRSCHPVFLTVAVGFYPVTTVFPAPLGFPGGLVVKKPPAGAGDPRVTGSIPGCGRLPGGGNDKPFQYSCLENSMHRGAWQATAHGVTKSQTRLSDWTTAQRTVPPPCQPSAAILTCTKWYHTVVLMCISFMTSDVEHLSIRLLATCVSSLEKCLFKH